MRLLPHRSYAKIILMSILAAYGHASKAAELQFAPIFTDHMVLPRNTYLPISGKGNPNSQVKLEIGGLKYFATADSKGNWSTTINPLYVGEQYKLTAIQGTDTISISDILAGEVWLASGQSNMEFHLRNCATAKEDIPLANDNMLRIYDMEPIAITNAKSWPDSIKSRINNYEHYKSAKWIESTPQKAGGWSAIAYHFGRTLRDSLNIPIGIIINAVGGSSTESWIDNETLANELPGMATDWKSNALIQDWVRKRAMENTGEDSKDMHPYMPSYLFTTGIKTLAQLPINGVIWYQGESNAHDTKLHEKLFPALIESWRKYFSDRDLPFIYAQLSSHDRPTWPKFRDSQRMFESKINNIWMVVTSDRGDSLDVHPKRKKEVGERMALTALNRVYEHENEYSGPKIISATINGDSILLKFSHSNGLSTSDGLLPSTFEVSQADKAFFPVQAFIQNDTIILKIKNMKNPKYVRYGWQPFTRANLINEAGLPTSTFEIEIENANELQIEAGYEKGVSGAFGGFIDGKVVMAGGCNFPNDPLGKTSPKIFYKGIYAAKPDNFAWERIGSLPRPLAYGMSATLPIGLVFIGGSNSKGSTTEVVLFQGKGLEQLPSLPVAVDNAYAANIGNLLIVAGGNTDGKASKSVYAINFGDKSPKWEKIAEMPGEARVQPIIGAAKNKKGENCLYVFSGFYPGNGQKEADLSIDGLCFNLKTKKWHDIPAAKYKDASVYFGGGVSAILNDGLIYACGGVNQDIFVEALRNQAPDYLLHPEEWYKFNPLLFAFNPEDESWTFVSENKETARAGAAIATDGTQLFLMGGELKPRIRTSSSLTIKPGQD